MKKILIFIFLFFAYNIFSQPRGQVITFDQNGNITPVDGANVRICGTNITSNTDQSGEYTFSEQLNIYIDKYILKVTKQNLVPTYTIISPTGLVEDFGKLNLIMMLPSVYSPQQGKSNLIVVTYQYNESENSFTPFFGAEARVYNSNNQRVDNSNNRKYINLSQWDQNGKPLKIELVNEPGDNTVGYVLLNIDPGYYSVSAYKSGYNFIHRPAITFPDSSTSGICEIDGIWIAEGTTNFEGVLRDEKDRPVENATCRTVGPDFYDNTDENGIFLLENLPYPSLLTLKFSKSGYKDAYYIRSIEEGENEFTIITTETFNQILQDLEIEVGQNKGHFVGVVLDYYGNPVKNIIVKVIDENGNEVGGIGVYYMDSNGSKFDKNLTKTTDKGIFLIPNLNPEEIHYLFFEIENINYPDVVDMALVFNNGITFWPLYLEYIQKGHLEIINPGQENPRVVNSDEQDVLGLKFNLKETTGYEDILLEVDTIIITDTGTGNLSKVSSVVLVYDENKNGQKDAGESVYNGTIDLQTRRIEFHPLNLEVTKGNEINLLILYNFNGASAGDEYKPAILYNSDIVAFGKNSILQVSVEGAPVEGNKITILTQGQPDISVEPLTYDFGEVKVGEESEELTINVTNTGTEQLVISQITFSGNTSDFALIEDNASNQTLNTGDIKTIVIKFKPQSNGTKTITITIPSNDPDENEVQVTLTGKGYGLPAGGGGGGCFIATACFGNYNHPIVKILREFRDKFLLTNKIGKSFVRWYYSHSPKYAEIISKSYILKGIVRLLLIPFVIFAYLCVKGLILPLILISSSLILFRRKSIKTDKKTSLY